MHLDEIAYSTRQHALRIRFDFSDAVRQDGQFGANVEYQNHQQTDRRHVQNRRVNHREQIQVHQHVRVRVGDVEKRVYPVG